MRDERVGDEDAPDLDDSGDSSPQASKSAETARAEGRVASLDSRRQGAAAAMPSDRGELFARLDAEDFDVQELDDLSEDAEDAEDTAPTPDGSAASPDATLATEQSAEPDAEDIAALDALRSAAGRAERRGDDEGLAQPPASVIASAEAAAGDGDDVAPVETIEELKKALEALLFAIGEPLSIRTLAELFGRGVHDIREATEELRFEYVETGRAFRLEDVAGGVQLLTLPAYDSWIRKLRQKQNQFRLSAAAFETLAVIAYKQPITKADLESIRGVQCGAILKTLLDRALIKVAGRDESLGRPLLYGTTAKFLESFGISSIRELPQPDQPRSRRDESENSDRPEGDRGSDEAAGDDDGANDA